VFSQNEIDHGPTNSWEESDEFPIAEGNTIRSLLARPFYCLSLGFQLLNSVYSEQKSLSVTHSQRQISGLCSNNCTVNRASKFDNSPPLSCT
jgi:hypothetical protein